MDKNKKPSRTPKSQPSKEADLPRRNKAVKNPPPNRRTRLGQHFGAVINTGRRGVVPRHRANTPEVHENSLLVPKRLRKYGGAVTMRRKRKIPTNKGKDIASEADMRQAKRGANSTRNKKTYKNPK